MNILLVTESYPPEIRSCFHLMQEMAEELRNRGHKVFVVAPYPKYNITADMEGKSFHEFTDENGIGVIRVQILPHHNVNFIIRGVSQLTMSYILFPKIKRHIKDKVDAIIAYSPPLPLTDVGRMVKKKYGAKFILNVQDIFPQNAIDLGIIKNPFVIKFFEWFERRAYKNADKITVHSENNKKFLLDKKRINPDKIHVLHNWVDIKEYTNVNGAGSFREKYGLSDKFIFLFAGVIGPSQYLELVINIAKEVKDNSDIVFLLVGDGMEKDRLVKMVEDYKLKNVIFKPFVSKEEYPKLVKDVDVGLVCLSSKNKTPVIPSKILGYMAASIPIVAFLNKESDGHSLIKDAGCGYSVVSDEYKKAMDLVMKMYKEKDKLKQYGENGFSYVSTYFDKSICISKLEKLLRT